MEEQKSAPELMWDKFIDHLNETVPLSKPKRGQPPPNHLNFLGSIKEYRKVFLEANEENKSVVR